MRLDRVRSWARAHLPELALVLLGTVLRITLHADFDPTWGYDSAQHWEFVDWVLQHGEIPPAPAVYTGYHPPLWYLLAASVYGATKSRLAVQWLSIGAGVLKLVVVWLGLEAALESPTARRAGLALAALLPVAVHMDGMLTNEVTSVLFAAVAMALVPAAFRASGARRWWFCTGIGVALSLQLLSKISAAACFAAIGLGVLLELVRSEEPSWTRRLRHTAPWVMLAVAPLVLDGWYFARNVRDYGKPLISSFDVRPDHRQQLAELADKPPLDRRPLGFVFGWASQIFQRPYQDVGLDPHPRYWTVITASTFVDYWNFRFAALTEAETSAFRVNGFPMNRALMKASQRSMLGGTAITLTVVVAWVACLVVAWRRRLHGFLALLALPVIAIASGLSFAVSYPFDFHGVIKASYLQFGMAPLYGVFGVAVAWTLERRRTWPLFVGLMTALWLVAAYTVYCRTRVLLLPL